MNEKRELMSSTNPMLCEVCREKWNKDVPLVIEVRWVYDNLENSCRCYCIHLFRKIKLTEDNLEMLERKWEEKV